LLETLRIKNGEIRNLEFHNRRFNASREKMFGIRRTADLREYIQVPVDLGFGTYRCRILYRETIEKIEFLPHQPSKVSSLKLVYHDGIEYSLKYADRELLGRLLEQKDDCDEILIVKNGYITDTSIGNICFLAGDGAWLTPDTPLLNGTMRMCLLERGRIRETSIRPEDLNIYRGAKMINCIMDLDSAPLIEMSDICS
jgi:4-amino-4-deoxychorismate lyase